MEHVKMHYHIYACTSGVSDTNIEDDIEDDIEYLENVCGYNKYLKINYNLII